MRGLPTLRALDEDAGGGPRSRLWLALEPTDMRCGFDRLAERVRTLMGQDPLSGHGFIFRSRRGDRLKILTWDQDGFVLWYKRLEVGVFKLPRAADAVRVVELRASELAMILDGIDVSRLVRGPRYERPAEETALRV
jgi:transposase